MKERLTTIGAIVVVLMIIGSIAVGWIGTRTIVDALSSGWTKIYGGARWDFCHSVVQTSDGGYALAGLTNSYGTGDCDFLLVKTDSVGTEQWRNNYGASSLDYVWSLVQTSDGGYAMAGYTSSFGAGGYDVYLVKTDANGNAQWNKTYGGAFNDYGYSMFHTSDGGYALAGSTDSYGAGPTNSWLVKTDSAGNQQWDKKYGGSSLDYVRSLVQTSDHGYGLAGYTDAHAYGAGTYSWLVKTDSAGNQQWNKTYGETKNDHVFSAVQTSDGGYALAGYTDSYSGDHDFWLVRTDKFGAVPDHHLLVGALFVFVRALAVLNVIGIVMVTKRLR